MSDDIRTVSRDELQARLDAGDDVKLVMALHEWAFHAARIPGSLHFATVDEAYDALDVDDDIVVYCSDAACVASQYAYHALVDRGYNNVRRYAGGLADWTAAGLPRDSNRTDPSHTAST
jgi:rhodanese-related sulfurtransferase